ncbi:5188_t:CDS:2 [Funneliformis geosporum]|nr:5188_t:CDS:2 [Funneliformis geosporum]
MYIQYEKITTDENINELDITESNDNTNIEIKNFSLDNNIDSLFERAVNALTNA